MLVIAFGTFVPAPWESEVTVNANDSPAALWVRKRVLGPRLEVAVGDASVGVVDHAVVVQRVGTQARGS